MLSPTYTSVKNANLVDCGKKQHIPSQPLPLLRDKFLGEYRTELDKKKVLANLGIATDLSLEWEYIKGDIGRSEALMNELDSRTKYISKIDGFQKTLIQGIEYLETIVGSEEEVEAAQNKRLTDLETLTTSINDDLSKLKTYLEETIEVNIETLTTNLNTITEKVNNITELIKVSTKAGNALTLVSEDQLEEGETPGLYVPDLSEDLNTASENIFKLQFGVEEINKSLETFVTKEELGGGDFNFVKQDVFDKHTEDVQRTIETIETELDNTVKTGEDGHVNTLYVNTISKEEGNIKVTDSFEVTSGIPLDIRCVVKTIDELYALDPKICYAGMGVIVSSQSSLYILREPITGKINEDYIKDSNSWKCPEDLIIEVLTQEQFDKKESEGDINPHMFYYIIEEDVEEPRREDFEDEESYQAALNSWLRVLQQKYMSAVWGREIEDLVSKRASVESVESLGKVINEVKNTIQDIQGGDTNTSIKTLGDKVASNTETLNNLTKEDGVIPTIQKEIDVLQDTSVTIDSITIDDPSKEYIFVKKTAFDAYKNQHAQEIATQLTTKNVITENITFGENIVNTVDNSLTFNGDKVALDKQVPVIELIDIDDYNELTEVDKNKYYFAYDTDDRYLLASEFEKYTTSIGTTIQSLNSLSNQNKLEIGILSNLTTSTKSNLVYALNEVHGYVSQLSDVQDSWLREDGLLTVLQKNISNLQNTIEKDYVTIKSITEDDPNVEYIFVKKSEFESYKINKDLEQSNQITTNSIILGNIALTSSDFDLLLNEEKVALDKNVPIIELVDSDTFSNKADIDSNTYYYIYDTKDRYVLESELNNYKAYQTTVVSNLTQTIANNTNSIGDLTALATESKTMLVHAINELVSKINDLTAEVTLLKEQINGNSSN